MPEERNLSATAIAWPNKPPELFRRSRMSPFNVPLSAVSSAIFSSKDCDVSSWKFLIFMYPMLPSTNFESTLGIAIISLISVTVLLVWDFLISTISITEVEGSPLSLLTASCNDMFMVESSSIAIILSPDLRPALNAGVPSIGEITVSIPSLRPTTIPSPPNLPEVPILNSVKSLGGKTTECGSNCASIPLIAAYSISSALIS